MYFGEADLLELRLTELDGLTDRIVLCESTHTFSGKPKPLYFENQKDQFDRWKDKITYIVYDPTPEDLAACAVRKFLYDAKQRDYLRKGIEKVTAEDWVLFSDLDEIPHHDDLAKAIEDKKPGRFWGYDHFYYINCRSHRRMPGPTFFKLETARAFSRERYNKANDLGNRGWHFTHLGDPEIIRRKALASSHTEYATDDYISIQEIERMRDKLQDLYKRRNFFQVVPIDDTFPKCVQENPDKWRKYLKDANN
jgi:beta-1,4-mannosyl-glycoprotein beta-1,4-N-acetylglucosaminyltransferase